MGMTVLGVSLLLVVLSRHQAIHLQTSATVLHVMVWGQAALGIATLYSFEHYATRYEYLSLAHLAWGSLVWLVACGLLMNLRYGKAGRAHG
jgi:heme A synthase